MPVIESQEVTSITKVPDEGNDIDMNTHNENDSHVILIRKLPSRRHSVSKDIISSLTYASYYRGEISGLFRMIRSVKLLARQFIQ